MLFLGIQLYCHVNSVITFYCSSLVLCTCHPQGLEHEVVHSPTQVDMVVDYEANFIIA
jgi:hypothetical protein